MINTNLNAYMQNGGIQKSNLQSQNVNKDSNTNKTTSNDEVNLVISDESKALMKIDDLKKQLEDIFGTKKALSPSEKERESQLASQIKEIDINSELPYSEDDKEKIEKLSVKIQEILEKDYHSFKDDKELFNLTKELNTIDNKYKGSTLSESDNTKKENLIKELRTLQGLKNPNAYELIEADKINKKVDIVKLELQLSQLDVNSDSYASKVKELSKEISSSYESLSKLDNEKEKYKNEEKRETAKSSISTSLSNIESIKSNFFNSTSSSSSGYDELLSLNKNAITENSAPEKENKWLGFLQDSRKDLYSGDLSENEKIRNLMQRVSDLHE
jgi:hypothetical protein